MMSPFLSPMKRTVITFGHDLELFKEAVNTVGHFDKIAERSLDTWNPGAVPTWAQGGLNFLPFIIEAALNKFADAVLWLDPTTEILGDLSPIWSAIDSNGSWFVCTGRRCSDSGLEVETSAFGLDLRRPACLRFLVELRHNVKEGMAATPELLSILARSHKLYAEEAGINFALIGPPYPDRAVLAKGA